MKGETFSVTTGDVQDRLVLEPASARAELKEPQRKQAFVDRVVEEELLLAEARRQKLDEVPEFKASVRSLLLQQLWQARARERNAAGPLDPAQQEAERKAWIDGLRTQARLEPQRGALEAFAP